MPMAVAGGGGHGAVRPRQHHQPRDNLTKDDLDRIRLAITEARANVVRHAYPDDSGTLEVGACLGLSRLVIDASDTGIGPAGRGRAEPGKGGLGLPLIDMLVVRVEITPHDPGTSVRMTFDLH